MELRRYKQTMLVTSLTTTEIFLSYTKIDKAPPFKKIAKNQVHILGSVRTSIQKHFEFHKIIRISYEEYEKKIWSMPRSTYITGGC